MTSSLQSNVSVASTRSVDSTTGEMEQDLDSCIKLPPGAELSEVDLATLRPTQMAVGMHAVRGATHGSQELGVVVVVVVAACGVSPGCARRAGT